MDSLGTNDNMVFTTIGTGVDSNIVARIDDRFNIFPAKNLYVEAYGATDAEIVVGSELGRIDIHQISTAPATGILFASEEGDIEITSIHGTYFNGKSGITVTGDQGLQMRSAAVNGPGYSASYSGSLSTTAEGGMRFSSTSTTKLQSGGVMSFSATGDNIFLQSTLNFMINAATSVTFDAGFNNGATGQLSRGELTIQSQSFQSPVTPASIGFIGTTAQMPEFAKLLIPSIDLGINIVRPSCTAVGEVVIAPNNLQNNPLNNPPDLAYPYLCVCNGFDIGGNPQPPIYVCVALKDWE